MSQHLSFHRQDVNANLANAVAFCIFWLVPNAHTLFCFICSAEHSMLKRWIMRTYGKILFQNGVLTGKIIEHRGFQLPMFHENSPGSSQDLPEMALWISQEPHGNFENPPVFQLLFIGRYGFLWFLWFDVLIPVIRSGLEGYIVFRKSLCLTVKTVGFL